MNEQRIDKTALSFWFPIIERAGLPVPKTIMIDMPVQAQECIWKGFDGEDGNEEQTAALVAFIAEVGTAARSLGLPAFLRSDHTSGKHDWKKTCYLDSDDPHKIGSHLFAIAEFSEICDPIGLPWSRWAIREYLPIMPFGTCPHYGDMPLCREYRFFIDAGAIKCWHGYWPMEAIERGGADTAIFESLSARPDEIVFELASKAARAIDGAWSVDIIETKRIDGDGTKWYVTDMAEASRSFHWPECHNAKLFS